MCMMKLGLLWMDLSNDDLPTKIARAAAFYKQKHGRTPNTCFVHPSMTGEAGEYGGVAVKAAREVLPGHFWVGVEEPVCAQP
jgi:hypothetical protein